MKGSFMSAKRKLHGECPPDRAVQKSRFQYTHSIIDRSTVSSPAKLWKDHGDTALDYSKPLGNMMAEIRHLLEPDLDLMLSQPRFLKPLPIYITNDGVKVLRDQGALVIPGNNLRIELVRCYIQWVHNFMPVLDLRHFLTSIVRNDPDGNISLLLFQVVMFLGVAFIDMEHLQAAGYETRVMARNDLRSRVKLLYAFNVEEDRVAIVQSILLMTYWSDQEGHPERDIWDWMGICNVQAYSVGLDRDPSRFEIGVRIRQLRKRLWWCLYARDCLIAMGKRRPTQVTSSDMPMLTVEDFDLGPYPQIVIDVFQCPQLHNLAHQECLAVMFIELAKLCKCISSVLVSQYSCSYDKLGSTNKAIPSLLPSKGSQEEYFMCTEALDTWFRNQPRQAQYIPRSKLELEEGEDVLTLHCGVLRMVYHATNSALHRPWAVVTDSALPLLASKETTPACTRVQEAVTGITHIIKGLNYLGLTRFLPQLSVTVIIPAAVAHLTNLVSGDSVVREAGLHQFGKCMQILERLQTVYPAAQLESSYLMQAFRMRCRPGGSVSNFPRLRGPSSNNESRISMRSHDALSKANHCSGDISSSDSLFQENNILENQCLLETPEILACSDEDFFVASLIQDSESFFASQYHLFCHDSPQAVETLPSSCVFTHPPEPGLPASEFVDPQPPKNRTDNTKE